jgi:hypothetical protein
MCRVERGWWSRAAAELYTIRRLLSNNRRNAEVQNGETSDGSADSTSDGLRAFT